MHKVAKDIQAVTLPVLLRLLVTRLMSFFLDTDFGNLWEVPMEGFHTVNWKRCAQDRSRWKPTAERTRTHTEL
jgi:hypothetical protein